MTRPEMRAPEDLVQQLAAVTMPPRLPRHQREEQKRRDRHTRMIRQWLDKAYADGFHAGMAFSMAREPARMVLTTEEFEQVRAKFSGTEQDA